MNLHSYSIAILHFVAIGLIGLLVPVFSPSVFAQQTLQDDTSKKREASLHTTPQNGGPASVGAQIESDKTKKKSAYHFEGLTKQMQPYFDFKARLEKEHGFSFGADYNALYQNASESPGEDHAASGILRFYGTWTLVGRDTPDQGSLVFKVENRHRLGTDITPQQLASEIGYAGLTAIIFSNAGSLLTNLYWQQSFKQNKISFTAGIVDTTDYTNVYGLVNPWTHFSNLTFSTDPTIPVPDQGLGAAIRVSFADNYYVLAGIADTNGDPGDPLEAFNTFFNEREYFKQIEFGRYSSWKNRFDDNTHLTIWQADEREAADVAEGWGAAFSFSKKFDERWQPFFRAAYSDGGGGSFLERSLSTGVGYFPQSRSDVLGIGLNWGQPSSGTYGDGLEDQFTAEVYYRLQLFQHTTITPDVQYLVNPALNPEEDKIWVFGLRARVVF